MTQDTFLYTLPQWFIFSAIIMIVYGWVEQKKPFRIIGLVIFILLGFFAIYAIVEGYFLGNEFLSPDEIVSEELGEELIENVPFQTQLLPAYWSFIVTAVITIPAIYFDWKNRKPAHLFIVIAGLVSLFGFFIIVGALRML